MWIAVQDLLKNVFHTKYLDVLSLFSAPPTVDVTVASSQMSVCFDSLQYVLEASNLKLQKTSCPTAVTRDTPTGACYDIDMDTCPPSHVEVCI